MNPMLMFLNPKGMMNNAINSLIQRNPQLKQVMDYVNANGGDPKAVYYKLAEEKGENPEEFLNSVKQQYFNGLF